MILSRTNVNFSLEYPKYHRRPEFHLFWGRLFNSSKPKKVSAKLLLFATFLFKSSRYQ